MSTSTPGMAAHTAHRTDSALGSLLSEPMSLQEVVNLLHTAFPNASPEMVKRGLSAQLTVLCGDDCQSVSGAEPRAGAAGPER